MVERYVTVLSSPDTSLVQTQFVLDSDALPLRIGRNPKAKRTVRTEAIDDKLLSREHLQIRCCVDGAMEVRDLDSKNGTRLNRVRLSAPATVWADGVLKLGDTVLHLGHESTTSCKGTASVDPAIRRIARRRASTSYPLAVNAAVGVAARTLAFEIHHRSR